MKLWALNKEFDIYIEYPYTYNFPYLIIKGIGNDFISIFSLRDISIIDAMKTVHLKFPDSIFLDKLIKQQGL